MLVIKKFTLVTLAITAWLCAFIIAILTKAKTNIKNFETVYTSSPSFFENNEKLRSKV